MFNVLKNQCGISQAYDPNSGGIAPEIKQFEAIWDTGATNCVITQAVIDACGLVATGMANVNGPNGAFQSETYLVNIALPQAVIFPVVRVTKGNFIGADVLIGMDIINKGDFAVTNLGGITKFSFRIPSLVHIDFVEDFRKKSQTPQFQHGEKQKHRSKRPKTFGRDRKKK